MGGGVWQDNFDGTYTQLDDDYYVLPPDGRTWTFILWVHYSGGSARLLYAAESGSGRERCRRSSIFKADRVKITIQDVIAVEGHACPAWTNRKRLQHRDRGSGGAWGQAEPRADGAGQRDTPKGGSTTGRRPPDTARP